MSTSSWQLLIQAVLWRNLNKTGFWVHSFVHPWPPNYTYVRSFTTGTFNPGGTGGTVRLYFYLPKDFDPQRRKYPVVINFHGGGFTLGSATDDSRWASIVLKNTTAVFVSVEYRLAPEYPFPVAVEDGCDAVLHLAANCEEYGIDPRKIALAGFSAGANLAFTVPLMLNSWHDRKDSEDYRALPELKIIAIVSFYPVLDYNQGRASKRAACKRPDKTIPPILTNLFDASYMPDPSNRSSPFASPAAAPDNMLIQALPAEFIGLYCCEWDMLHAEGLAFAERLESLGKKVEYETIPEVVHGFDKALNPLTVDPKADQFYRKACVLLHQAMGVES
ncbi:MAG: hypothetical protein Q9224_004211 [Gallowayella concinna]